MAITPQQFRADFPEFSSTAVYTNSSITFWLGLAYMLLNADRWGGLLDVGAELFAAHNISLEAKNVLEAAGGGIPGANTGPIESKKVDKVEVSYNTGAAMKKDAGHWNLTTYGTRYIYLLDMFGAGPVQVGIGSVPLFNTNAWTGPSVYPGFSSFA